MMLVLRTAVSPGPLAAILTAVAVAATAPPVAEAVKRKPVKSECQRLKANNRDRSPDPRLVLVLRGDGDEGRIYACVLPRGKVRRLAEWSDGLGRDGAEIAGTAGTFVLIGTSWGDQYGGASSSLERVDVRAGRRVLLAGFSCNANLDGCRSGTEYRRAVIAPSGAGALELFDLDTRGHSLHAFDSEGQLTRLDVGSVQALAITDGQIRWTRDGAEHRATLPERRSRPTEPVPRTGA